MVLLKPIWAKMKPKPLVALATSVLQLRERNQTNIQLFCVQVAAHPQILPAGHCQSTVVAALSFVGTALSFEGAALSFVGAVSLFEDAALWCNCRL